MSIEIFFNETIKESNLPLIRLTKSRNGKTGTASFVFFQPTIQIFLSKLCEQTVTFSSMSLVLGKKKVTTFDIQVFFRKGSPFLIQSIFVLKDSKEWFDFLTLLNKFSRENGLTFFYLHSPSQ